VPKSVAIFSTTILKSKEKTCLPSKQKVLRRIGGFLVAAPGENDAGKSRFERWWRPLFGYAVSLTWVLHMLTLCRVVWEDNPRAPEIIMALVETTSLWSVALGVLGISVVRETPKKRRRRSSDVNHS